MIFLKTLFFSLLIAQADTQPPLTNSGENFKDPFAEEIQPEEATPSNTLPKSTPPAPQVTSPTQPSAPSSNDEPEFEDFAPQQNSNLPPPPLMEEPAPTLTPKRDFNFPQIEQFKGPVDQEVLQLERSVENTRLHSWNMGVGLGMALNLNKRHQQIHSEVNGGYRLYRLFEVGGILSTRLMTDKLIGLIGTAKGFYTLARPQGMRLDLGYGGGLGWTFRAAHNTFNEGRFTVRLQTDFLFFPFPEFAIVLMSAYEGFLFSVFSDGTENLMKKGGAPSQVLLTLGTRWEF